ncbi:Pyridine nucleotide-disulphide oxidoreductase [Streptomyces yunnanensis]|uniref:Pyridine nucleotide-disulphide oxidoreductase n=1 Tax=Streptomyces yunnanensis TaxID=156453 RepID=A0A9X8N1X5_9ACTN|nr:FAD-dependent oxidoreductase [Streptomyces yunnanensis]SHM68323.1 Pyridine nucleotide-disulphide oxidoreductase [Streptomyces yunnanensis]
MAATGLDVERRQARLAGGATIDFDGLIIATGVIPRRLPYGGLNGVHVLRTLNDALALRAALLTGPRVVVVGAGFLGTEVAATARTMGLEVTLVEPEHCGVPVRGLCEGGGRVTGAELADGSGLPADVVVLALGYVPATDWLTGSGLTLANGVVRDALCRAAPGIYAAGDVASWRNPGFGTRMRLEHRMNATEQAMVAVGNLLGDAQPFAPVPYFWTDQYDTKIQAYGIFPPDAELRIDGDPQDGHFAAAYGRHGAVVGVRGWNAPRQVRALRSLVAERALWTTSTDTPAFLPVAVN